MIFSKVKKIWTDNDFEQMGWHDCRLYGFFFDYKNFDLVLNIDYIFEWVKDQNNPNKFIGFQVAPCSLIFEACTDLKISIDLNNTSDIIINRLKRENPRLTPNGKFTEMDYFIDLNNENTLSFSAIGYRQILNDKPTFSENQDLGRAFTGT